MTPHRITEPAALDRLVGRVASIAPHALPLFRAARDGLIEVVMPTRESGWPFLRQADDRRRPVVVLIGDDPIAGAAVGPEGWRCARRLPDWAQAAIVHGTGPAPEHYEAAVRIAVGHRRLVMVETDSAHLGAWAALFGTAVPVLSIRPPDDRQHPAAVERKNLQ